MTKLADPILSVKNLSVGFGGIKALNRVSLDVQKNSVTAIIGPNGAGKTTLFNCITGFYRSNEGEIVFNSEDKAHKIHRILNSWNGGSHKIASLGIARTFQNIRLFSEMSVIENLLVAQHNSLNRNIFAGILQLPSYRKSEQKALEEAKKWLELIELKDDANRLAGELSYGMQRRLEIARAMCTNAKIICLDEPAAGLNHRETDELSKFIERLRSQFNVTVLVIEHDMALVMNVSDYIVVLDHGEVISSGPPEYVKNDPKVLHAYLGDED